MQHLPILSETIVVCVRVRPVWRICVVKAPRVAIVEPFLGLRFGRSPNFLLDMGVLADASLAGPEKGARASSKSANNDARALRFPGCCLGAPCLLGSPAPLP
jgi:hypothetical protein